MTISGRRTEQLYIIAGFLPRHLLYEWFSQFHSCGTYSVLSRSHLFYCCKSYILKMLRYVDLFGNCCIQWHTACCMPVCHLLLTTSWHLCLFPMLYEICWAFVSHVKVFGHMLSWYSKVSSGGLMSWYCCVTLVQ